MYPVWEVPTLTAGLILGLIAAFHMLPSHLSTSAMWFNIFIERKALKEDRQEFLEFIKKYTLTLLVFAYVFGSLTGVGIWFSATVASPRGISGLIHNYVWGWATEWVFFILEVLGIYIYAYTLDKIEPKLHLRIGLIFAIASWTTMVVIVGILGFMLSPGKWTETGLFFDGFFNPTYWQQLFVRTGFMFTIAAAYALIVASRVKNEVVRRYVSRAASFWGLGGLLLGSLFGLWYYSSLPEAARNVLQNLPTDTLTKFMLISIGVTALYFILAAIVPGKIHIVPAILMIGVIFMGIWGAERTREMARKPYVIHGYMYSNQLIGNSIEARGVQEEISRVNREGILKTYPFLPGNLSTITDDNRMEAGRVIALIECSACHALNDRGVRPLPKMVARLGTEEPEELQGMLEILGDYPYMPPFAGTEEEALALATYLQGLVPKGAN